MLLWGDPHNQSNLLKNEFNWVCSSGMQLGQQLRTHSWSPSRRQGERRAHWESRETFEPSTPAPSGTPSPTRPRPLILPRQFLQRRTRFSSLWAYGAISIHTITGDSYLKKPTLQYPTVYCYFFSVSSDAISRNPNCPPVHYILWALILFLLIYTLNISLDGCPHHRYWLLFMCLVPFEWWCSV